MNLSPKEQNQDEILYIITKLYSYLLEFYQYLTQNDKLKLSNLDEDEKKGLEMDYKDIDPILIAKILIKNSYVDKTKYNNPLLSLLIDIRNEFAHDSFNGISDEKLSEFSVKMYKYMASNKAFKSSIFNSDLELILKTYAEPHLAKKK